MASERRRRSFALALVASLLGSPVARADGAKASAAQKETARSLMAEGRERRERSDLVGALESFLAADAIMKVPTTGLEVARAQAAIGQLVEARDSVRRVLRIPAHQDDPAVFQEARSRALALDDELGRRIPAIKLTLTGATRDAATADVDGREIPTEAVAMPIKVNPGHHVIVVTTASASGRAEADVAEGETTTATVNLVARPARPRPTVELRVSEPTERARPMRTVAWIGLGLAATGAAVGSVTGILSIAATARAKQQCAGDLCARSAEGDLSFARTTATASTVSFVVAGVGLAAAVTALIVGDRDAPTRQGSSARRVFVPWIGAGAGGVAGTF